jgi:hypothetical protein
MDSLRSITSFPCGVLFESCSLRLLAVTTVGRHRGWELGVEVAVAAAVVAAAAAAVVAVVAVVMDVVVVMVVETLVVVMQMHAVRRRESCA